MLVRGGKIHGVSHNRRAHPSLRHKARFRVGPRCQVKFVMRVPSQVRVLRQAKGFQISPRSFSDPVGARLMWDHYRCFLFFPFPPPALGFNCSCR